MRISCCFLALALSACSASAQWQLQTSHTDADLYAVSPFGWAAGKGVILHTMDNGKTWLPCATPPNGAGLEYRAIRGFGGQEQYVMSTGKGTLSRLFRTQDACRTWVQIGYNTDPEGFWDVLIVTGIGDSAQVLVIGDPVNGQFSFFGSTDRGYTLKQANMNAAAMPNEGIFAASNSAVGSGPGSTVMGTSGKGGGRVLVLARDSTSWVPRTIKGFPQGENAGIASVKGYNGHWVVVGGDFGSHLFNPPSAAYSDDDGNTWHLAATMPGGPRSTLDFDEVTGTWVAAGPNGTDISTDFGHNWQPLKKGLLDRFITDENWTAVALPYAVGPHGRIATMNFDTMGK